MARVLVRGAGARVAVRSVLEDHETAVLELERVVSIIEDRISELEHKVSGVCCDSEKRQLVVAELEGKFVLFSAEVIFESKSQWSGILNEVHGYCGDWLEEYRRFDALLAWKEDFIPKLWPLVHAVRGCCALSELWKNFLFYVGLLALFALGNLDTSPLSSYLSALVRCLGVACGVQRSGFFREILRARHLVRQWIHVLREALDEFLTFSTLR